MKIVFRVDSSIESGSGHVMRCLTMADELRNHGADILFICRDHPGNMIGFITGKGWPVVSLTQQRDAEFAAEPDSVAHAEWLGVSWQQDAAGTIAAVGKTQPAWLIVDHYAIDFRWEQELRPHVNRIMAIDDLADRLHDCDLLLDQNLYQEMETRYEKLVIGNCKKLLGPKFSLLRPEFIEARKHLHKRDGQVRRVLVFFGGVDQTNETEKALQALTVITDKKFEVDVVVGDGNLHKERIINLCAAYPGFHYHCNVDNMAELMVVADLAVGAGGTATWERCCLGLPSIVLPIANNQLATVRQLGIRGALADASCLIDAPLSAWSHFVEVVSSDPESLVRMGMNGMSLVDGRGVTRVARLLKGI